MKTVLYRSVKILLRSILVFNLLVFSYLLATIFVSRLEVPAKRVQEEKNVEVFILSNGVHTDLVLPVKNKHCDWSKIIKYEHTRGKDTSRHFLAFGWGDKGFYLETPQWSDLKARVALNATFGLGGSAIHTCFHSEMKEDENCRKIKITQKQYQRLCTYIRHSFMGEDKVQFIDTDAAYGDNDAFYNAKGSYSMLKTCNSWANGGLIAAEQKAACWTAFPDGIFCHYE